MTKHLISEIDDAYITLALGEDKARRCRGENCPAVSDLASARTTLASVAMIPNLYTTMSVKSADLYRGMSSLTELVGNVAGSLCDGLDPLGPGGEKLTAEEFNDVEQWTRASVLLLMDLYAMAHAHRET